jgi:hypothetical protein
VRPASLQRVHEHHKSENDDAEGGQHTAKSASARRGVRAARLGAVMRPLESVAAPRG